MATAKTQAVYDVHPGVGMVQKWVAELKSKTVRSLEEWFTLVKNEGPEDEKARREWQANNEFSRRFRFCVDALQRETA